jgi:hypothetical protein
MERDKMLDHVDALILALAGPAALQAIETAGNQLERFVEQTCPNSQAFDPCRTTVLSNPTTIMLRKQGVDAANAAATRLSVGQELELVKLATFRMTAQATYEPKAQLVGPASTWTVDFRFDDAALNFLMTERDANAFKTTLKAYAGAVGVSRIASVADIAAKRAQIDRDTAAKVDELAAKYEAASNNYRRLLGIEKAVISKLGPVGPRTLEVRVPVDTKNRPIYEEAAAGSLAEARSRVVTAMFDSVLKRGGGFTTHVEQVAGYALLGMLEPARLDLRVDAKLDVSDGFSQDFSHYRTAGYGSFDVYGKGDRVLPIDGGLFSIDALIEGQ